MVDIRLVRRDGKLIHLNCTNYTIAINKSVIVAPIPITAERFGADLNMVQSDIRLECILIDDECSSADYGKSYSKATIDFSVRQEKIGDDNQTQDAWMTGDGGNVYSELDGAVVILTGTPASAGAAGTEFKITLETSNNTWSVSGNDITVGILNDDTASELTSRLYTALTNTDSGAGDIYSNFQAAFTTAKKAGVNSNLSGETALTFTQKVDGSLGATETPILEDYNASYSPKISQFSYEADDGCQSAGDKAQNLISTVANNSVLGAMGKLAAGESGIPLPNEGFDLGSSFFYGGNHSDYIVGLQLPYNSLAQDSLSNVGDPVSGYNTRNFIYVTGAGVKAENKDSSSNVLDAGVDFVFSDKYTGISGTITQCDITYDAGATVYKATITFQPLDFVMGFG